MKTFKITLSNEHFNSSDPLLLNFQRFEQPKSYRQAQNDPLLGYVCNRCGKRYDYSSNLRRHLRYECGVMPRFSCFYCNYRCKQKANMQKHVGMRHKDLEMKYNVDPE